MNGRGRYGWGFALAALLFGLAIAMFAYNLGVSDGVATGGAAGEVARRVQWGWHGAGVLWPLFWIAFFVFIWRGACWRRHYWYGGPYRPYSYGPPPADDEFDQWHRRAHERMKEDGPADNPGSRG
jgi:hypothetical protein